MTLVIGCVTPNHVVQVSDRRLTFVSGPRKGEHDDDENKAVIICNRIAVAYTGFAELEGQKTDQWLVDVLRSVNPATLAAVTHAIATQARKALRRIRRPSTQKHHAFLLAGWANLANVPSSLSPFLGTISNGLSDWAWTPDTTPEFATDILPLLQNQSFLLGSVGQVPPRAAWRRLARNLKSYSPRERTPEAYIQMLAATIRETAAAPSSKGTVGVNLMAVALPSTGVNSRMVTFPRGIPLNSRGPVAVYLPGPNDGPVQYAPNVVCDGAASWGSSYTPIGSNPADGIITTHVTPGMDIVFRAGPASERSNQP